MDTTYVISVDSLDLSLLPLTYQNRRNVSSLWNRHDDLTEFTIHVGNTSPIEERATEVSTPRALVIETTMCHMCKVDIPKQFLKEHKESPKHKTYKKIANIALQRIKEHINVKCDCGETKVDTLTYFCSHCVAVVNINERKSHENSDIHKNAVFLDKCLSNFLDLYAHFDKTDNDDNNSNIIEASSSSKKHETEDNKFDLKNYMEILKNKYKMSMKFRVIDEEKLEFEIDGRKVEVAAQNFHSLKTTSSDSLECVVCREVVNVNDKINHIMGNKHMHRVSISFKDTHCKREIYPSWHHCVLCNLITDNSDHHTISDPAHQKFLQEALKYENHNNSIENSISSENWTLVTNKTSKTEVTTNKDSSQNQYSDLLDTDNSMVSNNDILSTINKTFCAHCNVYIVTKNLRKHTSTKKHLCNMISKYHYLFNLDLDTTSCKVCDVVVNVDDFEKHVNLSEHENKYNLLLATNKIRKIDNHIFSCGACDKLVLVKNELYHIKANDHIQCLESHRDSSPTSDYHCSICDVRVQNTDSDIQTHNGDMSHIAKKLENSLDSVSTVKSYFYNYTMLETQSPGLVNCSVCEILVPKEEELIQKHIESENHIRKYEKLLQDHQLVLTNDNIYCNICKVFAGLKSEIMHVRGKRHLKNVIKSEENEMSNISLSVEDNAKLEAQLKVKSFGLIFSEADLNVILDHFDISDNIKQLICKTCQVAVPFTTYNCRGHLEGSKHKQKLKDIEIMNSESNSAS